MRMWWELQGVVLALMEKAISVLLRLELMRIQKKHWSGLQECKFVMFWSCKLRFADDDTFCAISPANGCHARTSGASH